jgi:DNA-binding PadR family transcriptional regulator
MARGRKSASSIKCITSRDFELFKGIARTGITSKFDARNIIGLSERRLRSLEKSEYIYSKSILANKGNETVKVYYLDDKGKSYVKLNTTIDKFYRSNERQVEHDLKLSSIYYSLDRKERETWTNENDLINEYKIKNPNKKLETMIDATFTTHGQRIAVEVVTKNYTKGQIEEKFGIANEIGCKEVVKIET